MFIQDMKRLKPDFLIPAQKRGYVCPWCGNGSGIHGTGIEPFGDPPSYRCHVCNNHGDVIDLFGAKFGIYNDKEKFKQFRAYYGIDPDAPDIVCQNKERINLMEDKKPTKKKTAEETMAGESFMDYYKECMAYDGKGSDYFEMRGISPATQKHFLLGIDPLWRHPNASDSVPANPRAIIPISKSAYLARDIREQIPDSAKQYEKQDVGRVGIFNPSAFKRITNESRVLYVTEGPFDAMSIAEVGGNAIALCGIANTGMLIDHLKNHPALKPCVLIMLDNDERGREATKELKEKLHAIEIECKVVKYDAQYKDPNEFLVRDRNGLKTLIKGEQAYHDALAVPQVTAVEYYKNMESQKPLFVAKTGFSSLDRMDSNLGGGIHEGVHTIGAMPSEGKTTLFTQISDQTAQTGTHVLYFSTEQTRFELAGRSIARETYAIAGDKKITVNGRESFLAKDYWQIRESNWYKSFTTEERGIINQAIDKYASYCNNITIIDRDSAMRATNGEQKFFDAEFISNTTKAYIERTGNLPLVVIDFIQDLAPADLHMTDKQSTDQSIAVFKALALFYHIPVVVVSSFNRYNYTEPINMASFKDSGSIEYSSDFLYGLQQHGMDYNEDDKGKNGSTIRKTRIPELRENNEKRAREGSSILLDFKCLKQRNGMKFNVVFKAVPKFGYFTDNVGETDFLPTDATPFDDLKQISLDLNTF